MADPVSWFLIAPGWEVVDEAGQRVGRVEEVLGDAGQDIWDGLSVARGLTGDPDYVAAERVTSIVDGRITIR